MITQVEDTLRTVAPSLFGTAFVIGWCIAAAGWFLGLSEYVGVHRLRPWACRLGPVVVRRTDPAACAQPLALPRRGETASLKFKVLEDRRCLFRRKAQWFPFRWNAPFEFKGELCWIDDAWVATGRFPLGVLLFFGGWLFGWTSGGIMVLIRGDLQGVIFLVFGWLLAGGMMARVLVGTASICGECRRIGVRAVWSRLGHVLEIVPK